MARKRIPAQERRALILASARRMFFRHGYERAKTQQIAEEAGVSEALVYRHFPTKLALYRAVLRQVIREQNENYIRLGLREPTTASLVRTLKVYFSAMIGESGEGFQEGFRLLLASLAGDGSYANLVYRRAVRILDRTMPEALGAARAAGDLQGELLPSASTSMFIEHIGTMMNAILKLDNAPSPYRTNGPALVRQAVWFCCRGIGLTDEAIARHYGD